MLKKTILLVSYLLGCSYANPGHSPVFDALTASQFSFSKGSTLSQDIKANLLSNKEDFLESLLTISESEAQKFLKSAIEAELYTFMEPLSQRLYLKSKESLLQFAILNTEISPELDEFLPILFDDLPKGNKIHALGLCFKNKNISNRLVASLDSEEVIDCAVRNVEMDDDTVTLLTPLVQSLEYKTESILNSILLNGKLNSSTLKLIKVLVEKLSQYDRTAISKNMISNFEMSNEMLELLKIVVEPLGTYDKYEIAEYIILKSELNEPMVKFLTFVVEPLETYMKQVLAESIISKAKLNEPMVKFLTVLIKTLDSYNREIVFNSVLTFSNISILKPVIKTLFEESFSVSNASLQRIMELNDNDLLIDIMNNVHVLSALVDDASLRDKIFNVLQLKNQNICDILEQAKPKIIESAKKSMKESQDTLRNRRSTRMNESVSDFHSINSVLKPLYLKTQWQFPSRETLHEELKRQIDGLHTALEHPNLRNVFSQTMTDNIAQGLEYMKTLMQDQEHLGAQINAEAFITLLDTLEHSPTEQRRRAIHNAQSLFMHYHAKENAVVKIDKDTSLEIKWFTQAKALFNLDKYRVNSSEHHEANAELQRFVNDLLEKKIVLKNPDRANMPAVNKFYQTHELLSKQYSLWDNDKDLENIDSSGRMLIEFLIESVTLGATGGRRCAGGVSSTMAMLTFKALHPDFQSIDQTIDYTKNLRCDPTQN